MKGFYFLLLLLFAFSAKAQKQLYTLQHLVEYISVPQPDFDAFSKKKGFQPFIEESSLVLPENSFQKISKDKLSHRIIGRFDKEDTTGIIFYTNSSLEFNQIKEELVKNNFFYQKDGKLKENRYPVYVKGNLTVYLTIENVDDRNWYAIKAERKNLPNASAIRYAEDLLQINSHEYLTTVFGEQNVKKDLFYFSEKEFNKCTILFPNTSVQVIFIWEDEVYNKNISFLILGGQLGNNNNVIYNGNEFHKWRSSQGVFLGMSLKELQELNGRDVDFFGWETDQPGHVSSVNSGKINLKNIGIQLNCLDCYKDAFYSKNDIINSKSILKTNSRAMISTMIILPQKKVKEQLALTQIK